MRTRVLLVLSLWVLPAACSNDVAAPERALEVTALTKRTGVPPTELDAGQLEATFARTTARADHVVPAGGSIQEVVDLAKPGAVIHIQPGIYEQTVIIDKPNIKLVGRRGQRGEGVVLVNPGGARDGIRVTANGAGVAIANLTTRGYDANGIFMSGVEGFFVLRVTAEDNGAYGIFPTRSSDGVMLHCTASGHADAGLYIGQSSRVRMLHNTAFANVIGIEISNSVDVVARHNAAYGNTIGILAVLLPPSPFRTMLVASDFLIAHNRIENNNLPNFAAEGDLASFVPSGSGILVVGVDRTVVEHNIVRGHDWVGIGVGSTATLIQLAGFPPEVIAELEPDPDGVIVRSNRVTQNGLNPPSALPLPGADLFWDGTGTANCWEKNRYQTSFPPILPPCR
jgi:parallel beta-helix repeat protein